MQKALQEQQGVTLIEMLLAVAVLVMVVTAILAVLFTGHSTHRFLTSWVEGSQQMRTAIRQLNDDITYADWNELTPTNNDQFVVRVYKPVSDRWDPIWDSVPTNWPGDLIDWPTIYIRYRLEGDSLVREVIDGIDANLDDNLLYSRRVLASGLIPYTSSCTTCSSLQVNLTERQVKVLLLARRERAGVTNIARVFTQFYLR